MGGILDGIRQVIGVAPTLAAADADAQPGTSGQTQQTSPQPDSLARWRAMIADANARAERSALDVQRQNAADDADRANRSARAARNTLDTQAALNSALQARRQQRPQT